MPAAAAKRLDCGSRLNLTPRPIAVASSPSPHSPPRVAYAALCKATSDEEHAVSMLMQGPCIPKTKRKRPAATEMLSPVTAKIELRSSLGIARTQSGRSMARKTPASPPSKDVRRFPQQCSAS
eukprot:7279449-Prymnesium_polylepis.1